MAPRPDPFERMEQLFDQMRRSMIGQWEEPWDDAPALPGVGTFESNVSLEQIEDGYVALADLPGFERDEIDVRIADGRLTIGAVHEAEDGDEYRSRSVRESVTLPGDVDVDAVEATYRNGVLEITLPASEDIDDHYTIPVE